MNDIFKFDGAGTKCSLYSKYRRTMRLFYETYSKPYHTMHRFADLSNTPSGNLFNNLSHNLLNQNYGPLVQNTLNNLFCHFHQFKIFNVGFNVIFSIDLFAF